MHDYSQYQGPSEEWEAFAKANALPTPLIGLWPSVLRSTTNSMRVTISGLELERDGLCKTVSWQDYSVLTSDQCNIIARVYRPKSTSDADALPVYLYFHGGGHLFGNVETEDAACARIADRAGILVVSVNYRHTPEFKHPKQVCDGLDTFVWLRRNIDRIGGDRKRVIVGGISAGACIAAVVAQQNARDSSLTICGQLLCIPWLIHPDNNPNNKEGALAASSYQQNKSAPVLPLSMLEPFTNLLGAEDPTDLMLNPGLADDATVAQLPKTSFIVAGQDLLRDEGLAYSEKLRQNGVPVRVHVFPGMPHGFRRYTDLRASTRWDELLVEGCKWFLSDDRTFSDGIIEERP